MRRARTAQLGGRTCQLHSVVARGAAEQGALSSSDTGEDGGRARKLSREEVDERVRQAVSIISTAEQLAPYDPQAFNAALLVWRKIAGIPAAHRGRLLRELSSADIKRLWRLSAKRQMAPRDEQRTAMGNRPLWADLPRGPGEVAVFDGKAALPLHTLGVSLFSKAFFLGPGPEYTLYGRVLLQYGGALGGALYPLYYRASARTVELPATGEVADMSLEYLPPQELGLAAEDLPDSSWPAPGPQRYPFHGGLTDYVRPVGPGVYVGVGWREPRPGVDLGRQFLHFLLVARHP